MSDDVIVLEGKKINLIWIEKREANAHAHPFKRTIILSKILKKILTEREFKAILLHERGHFEWYNVLSGFMPCILLTALAIFGFLGVFLGKSGLAFTLLCIFIFSLIPFLWLKEVLADIFALRRTSKGVFSQALAKACKWNSKIDSRCKRYLRLISHPPPCLRQRMISCYEKRARED